MQEMTVYNKICLYSWMRREVIGEIHYEDLAIV